MAIGPEARRQASGRVVVVAGLFAAVGIASIVLGLGPLAVGSSSVEQTIGAIVIGMGVLMLVAAIALATRRGPTRPLGVAASLAVVLLGTAVALGAVSSLDACGARDTRTVECAAIVGGAAMLGLGVAVAGIGCLLVVIRGRPTALRRARGPASPAPPGNDEDGV
jgi:hypothetical protein